MWRRGAPDRRDASSRRGERQAAGALGGPGGASELAGAEAARIGEPGSVPGPRSRSSAWSGRAEMLLDAHRNRRGPEQPGAGSVPSLLCRRMPRGTAARAVSSSRAQARRERCRSRSADADDVAKTPAEPRSARLPGELDQGAPGEGARSCAGAGGDVRRLVLRCAEPRRRARRSLRCWPRSRRCRESPPRGPLREGWRARRRALTLRRRRPIQPGLSARRAGECREERALLKELVTPTRRAMRRRVFRLFGPTGSIGKPRGPRLPGSAWPSDRIPTATGGGARRYWARRAMLEPQPSESDAARGVRATAARRSRLARRGRPLTYSGFSPCRLASSTRIAPTHPAGAGRLLQTPAPRALRPDAGAGSAPARRGRAAPAGHELEAAPMSAGGSLAGAERRATRPEPTTLWRSCSPGWRPRSAHAVVRTELRGLCAPGPALACGRPALAYPLAFREQIRAWRRGAADPRPLQP